MFTSLPVRTILVTIACCLTTSCMFSSAGNPKAQKSNTPEYVERTRTVLAQTQWPAGYTVVPSTMNCKTTLDGLCLITDDLPAVAAKKFAAHLKGTFEPHRSGITGSGGSYLIYAQVNMVSLVGIVDGNQITLGTPSTFKGSLIYLSATPVS